MPRSPRPADLYRVRIATEPRLSPDGRFAIVALTTSAPRRDGYRTALWLVPTNGEEPRQLTLGLRSDHHPRFSPDGRTLAFLSDRRPFVEEEPERPADRDEREDATQVHVLALDGGEARRLTDLPRGVTAFEWAPDGRSLVVTSSSHAATYFEDARLRRKSVRHDHAAPPESDLRFIDRLDYMLNGEGFTYDRVDHLWIVDVVDGTARRLTGGPAAERSPAWSPDGRRIAFVANRHRDHDLLERSDIFVADARSGDVTPITRGPKSLFDHPTWLPDGATIAALGHRFPAGSGSRDDVWLFAADGSEAHPDGGRNLSARHDLMPGSGMSSDLTTGEEPRLEASTDGRWLTFTAPIDGSYELWRIALADGRLERLTEGRHYISSWDRVAATRGRADTYLYLRSSPTEMPDLWLLERPGATARKISSFNGDLLGDLELREPVERRVTVDGAEIQGWLIPAGKGRRPLVVEIHGGPHTLYGWSPLLEFQLLAANGMSVFYCNPRGSQGYGQAFNAANYRDWGPGPARDVLAGVDALVADGLADPDRLGVTGGSYGGYLTNWIVGHDDRFRAAMTCRSVSDMGTLMLTGDISNLEWAALEFGGTPLEDPGLFREISPLTYAAAIRTPLLIQHSERDIRTTVGQAEALFTALRTLRRPVRLLRVPEETHELTRSGTPFRRAENLEVVLGWFRHYLVDGKRGMPPIPKIHGGR
ncbi:MAG TPA: S9 family peptidase [Candidatus Limnocylindrales bacterium]|nr:S9 family peptidase [Candidatus Limnocylindrales bacterium]